MPRSAAGASSTSVKLTVPLVLSYLIIPLAPTRRVQFVSQGGRERATQTGEKFSRRAAGAPDALTGGSGPQRRAHTALGSGPWSSFLDNTSWAARRRVDPVELVEGVGMEFS